MLLLAELSNMSRSAYVLFIWYRICISLLFRCLYMIFVYGFYQSEETGACVMTMAMMCRSISVSA